MRFLALIMRNFVELRFQRTSQNNPATRSAEEKGQKLGAASRVRRSRPVLVRLLCSCLVWCFRRVCLQALFGDAQRLIVQVGLLGHVPYLRDYHRPENQQRDRRGDGLLAEDTHPSLYRGPICYRLYLYVQGALHAYYGLEGASLADAHLRPTGGDVGFGNLEVLALEVAHHVLSDGSDVLDKVGKGLGRVKGSHPKRLLSLWACMCPVCTFCRFLPGGLRFTAAPKKPAGEAPAGRLAPPSRQRPLWRWLWPLGRAPLLAA